MTLEVDMVFSFACTMMYSIHSIHCDSLEATREREEDSRDRKITFSGGFERDCYGKIYRIQAGQNRNTNVEGEFI